MVAVNVHCQTLREVADASPFSNEVGEGARRADEVPFPHGFNLLEAAPS